MTRIALLLCSFLLVGGSERQEEERFITLRVDNLDAGFRPVQPHPADLPRGEAA